MKQRIRTPDSVARDLDIRRNLESIVGEVLALNADGMRALREWLSKRPKDKWGRDMPTLLEEFRWADFAAHQPTVRERASSGASVADDGSVPGPTASVAAAKEKMRHEVTSGAKKVSEALSLLRQARSHFTGALRALTPDRYDDQSKFPRTATDDDLAQAKEAKARRTAAGAGWGEG